MAKFKMLKNVLGVNNHTKSTIRLKIVITFKLFPGPFS